MKAYLKQKFINLIRLPLNVEGKNYRKYAAILVAAVFGITSHLAFIYVFYKIDISILAVVNIASVAAWIWVLWENYVGRHSNAITIACFEVALHAIFAVSIVGLSAGFQFYLWPIACLAVINNKLSLLTSSFMGFACILLFAAIEYVFGHVTHVMTGHIYFEILYTMNAIFAGAPLVLGIASIRRLYELHENKLTKLATIDDLTGLYNRRYFHSYVSHYRALAVRNCDQFCIVLGDIDNFKKVNDAYGHDAGDHVLVDVANYFTKRMRKSDLICRWGGEEFLMVLSCQSYDVAYDVINEIRRELPKNVKIKNPSAPPLTMSFGMVQTDGKDSIDDIIKRADVLLYKAKDAGKNCVMRDPVTQTLEQLRPSSTSTS